MCELGALRVHGLRVKPWAHPCVQRETQEASREKTENNQASEVSVKEGSRQQKEGEVCATQEVGGKLGKTRIVNCVTHSTQGEQVEVALVMWWSLMVDSSQVRLIAPVECWEQKP